jgi:hypothetical protein
MDGLTDGTYSVHLTMTGAHTAVQDSELTFNRLSVTGHSTSTLDGHTISGPSPDLLDGGACPGLLPHKPALRARAQRLRPGTYRVTVTASIAGMGLTESAVDTRPVAQATVRVGGRSTKTNARGVAIVSARRAAGRASITAGNTLRPTTVALR